MARTIGIDIHKDTLVLAVHGGRQWTTTRTPDDLATLVAELARLQPSLIVLEASGGYERTVLAALHAAHLPVARVNPRQVRHFAKAARIAAKADRLDARVLASYGATMQPLLTPTPTPTATRLATLTTRCRQLTEMAAAEQRRRENADPPTLDGIARHLAFLTTEIAELTRQITALVDADPILQRRRTILCSVPGIGKVTAHLLLAELSELGTLDPKALASLVGVAPFTQQSGAAAGTAHIDGGRRHVRTGLWMPTLCAMTRNPVIRAFRDRLHEDHKIHKVVTIACMRKLLTILNAMLAREELWTPRLPNP